MLSANRWVAGLKSPRAPSCCGVSLSVLPLLAVLLSAVPLPAVSLSAVLLSAVPLPAVSLPEVSLSLPSLASMVFTNACANIESSHL